MAAEGLLPQMTTNLHRLYAQIKIKVDSDCRMRKIFYLRKENFHGKRNPIKKICDRKSVRIRVISGKKGTYGITPTHVY